MMLARIETGAAPKWSPELTTAAKALWEEGRSAAEISRTPGVGRSRNAVIGKKHREGWERMPRANGFWNAERDATLRQLVGQKMSTRDMGFRLGVSYAEVSRRCKALDLRLRPPCGQGRIPRKRGTTGGLAFKIANKTLGKKPTAVAPLPVEPPKPPTCEPVTLIDAKPNQCRFVIGEPNGPETLFCGGRREIGFSFCEYHHRVAYHAPQPRRNRALERMARAV